MPTVYINKDDIETFNDSQKFIEGLLMSSMYVSEPDKIHNLNETLFGLRQFLKKVKDPNKLNDKVHKYVDICHECGTSDLYPSKHMVYNDDTYELTCLKCIIKK